MPSDSDTAERAGDDAPIAPATEGELYDRLQRVVAELEMLASYVDVPYARAELRGAALRAQSAFRRWVSEDNRPR